MSHPRRVLKGSTLAVVRRCSERRFFLRPGRHVNRLIRFLLATYARKHGIKLHAFVFMGNHFHLILTDTRRRLPLFMEQLDSMLTRVLNKHLGRSGRLWESKPYSHWILETQEELLQHLVYLAANPVEAWVVRDPARWPGVLSLPSHVNTQTKVKPPRQGLFGRGSTTALPAESLLELHVPPYFEAEGPERYRQLFQTALDAYLATLHARPGSYAGRNSAKRLDPFSAPRGARTGPTFGLIPALTNATKEKRQELKEWRHAVRAAFYRWQIDKTTVFPQGTWQVVKRHKARAVPD
jgi:REP-associated tyrosine transposase